MSFRLCFNSDYRLCSNDDGLKLMKEYNQLIKSKQYLEELIYKHQAIDGYKDAYSTQKV